VQGLGVIRRTALFNLAYYSLLQLLSKRFGKAYRLKPGKLTEDDSSYNCRETVNGSLHGCVMHIEPCRKEENMEEKTIMIRLAKEEELMQVNLLRKQVHELHYNGREDIFKSDGWEDIKDIIEVRFASEESNVIVACLEQEIVGFAIVQYIHKPESPFQRARDFCHIEEFGVDKDHRRRGIATQLTAFIKKDALDRGFSKVELNMWEFNESALRFYESVGFRTYRRDLEIFMER